MISLNSLKIFAIIAKIFSVGNRNRLPKGGHVKIKQKVSFVTQKKKHTKQQSAYRTHQREIHLLQKQV